MSLLGSRRERARGSCGREGSSPAVGCDHRGGAVDARPRTWEPGGSAPRGARARAPDLAVELTRPPSSVTVETTTAPMPRAPRSSSPRAATRFLSRRRSQGRSAASRTTEVRAARRNWMPMGARARWRCRPRRAAGEHDQDEVEREHLEDAERECSRRSTTASPWGCSPFRLGPACGRIGLQPILDDRFADSVGSSASCRPTSVAVAVDSQVEPERARRASRAVSTSRQGRPRAPGRPSAAAGG